MVSFSEKLKRKELKWKIQSTLAALSSSVIVYSHFVHSSFKFWDQRKKESVIQEENIARKNKVSDLSKE